VCRACNTGLGMVDDIERLEKRVAFLKAHEKRWSALLSSSGPVTNSNLVYFVHRSCYIGGSSFVIRRSGSGSTPPTALLSRK
jgi:hypothetical protein